MLSEVNRAQEEPALLKTFMRVLHVIPSLDSHYGGPSYVAKSMASFQSQTGIIADILTTYKKHRRKLADCLNQLSQTVEPHCGGHIFSFPSSMGEYKFSAGLFLWLSANIASYDLVHIHSVFCFSTFVTARLAKKRAIPYILRPIGQFYPWAITHKSFFIKKWYLALIENKTLSSADAIHFTSDDEAKKSIIPVSFKQSYVLALGVDFEDVMQRAVSLKIYPQLETKKVLLFLSRIHAKKGLDLILPWLAPLLLSSPNWFFVIAGEADDKEYLDYLKQLIQKHDIGDRVLFTGHVDGKKKSALLSMADVFILPSHSENFGIAVVEAMAAGVPVVISDQVALQKEIAENEAGIVFKLEEADFKKKMESIMACELYQKKTGAKGRVFALKNYSWADITKRQIALYHLILDERRHNLSNLSSGNML